MTETQSSSRHGDYHGDMSWGCSHINVPTVLAVTLFQPTAPRDHSHRPSAPAIRLRKHSRARRATSRPAPAGY